MTATAGTASPVGTSLRTSGRWWSRPKRDVAPLADTLDAMAQQLARHRQSHLPVSLVVVRLEPGLPAQRLRAMLGELAAFGPAGALPEGGVGLLYIGEPDGGRRRDAWLDAVTRLLRELGTTPGLRRMRVATAHRWTDALTGVNELFAALQ
jgi:hypothetical protein